MIQAFIVLVNVQAAGAWSFHFSRASLVRHSQNIVYLFQQDHLQNLIYRSVS
jgi:hypothetical protein